MKNNLRKFFSVFAVLLFTVAILTGGPAQSIAGDVPRGASALLAAANEEDINDPLEPMNRAFFQFNEFLQAIILRPMAELYRGLIPPPVREAIGNAVRNLTSPVILANDILQGEPNRAWQTTSRFVINTTVGVGGLWDAGEKLFDIPGHDEDFGQTLGVWGVGEGFYLVLPILGPSSPRDGIGEHIIDAFFDPLNLWAVNTGRDGIKWGRAGVGAVHVYSGLMDELDQTRKTSIDYYATIRSIYRQKREVDVRNGEDVDLPPIPDLTPDISLEPDTDGQDFYEQQAQQP